MQAKEEGVMECMVYVDVVSCSEKITSAPVAAARASKERRSAETSQKFITRL
jgi:hypothetical protein